MPDARLLVVEDDIDQRRLVCPLLRGEGYAVAEAGSVDAALEELARSPVDLVVSDWKLPGRDGIELLAEVRARYPETAFIVVTAYGTISSAVKAVRQGADDYLTKPFEKQALLLAVERTLTARGLRRETQRLSEELLDRDRLVDLVGRSASMQAVFRRVEKLAGTAATVLVSGESGTGKELAARALHALSRRRAGPFVAVNCAAIPENLLEAEFFGAEKGAFTGAERTRLGRFEAANEGTLFLDEIGELPLHLQPKLLRAIQEGNVTRVGGNAEIRTDVRIVAATNRELSAEVSAGRFREDLFYRLNVVSVEMPPLRERREDIPLLVSHFVGRAERRHGVRVAAFPQALVRRLVDYAWPGNVRELANVVERLVLLSEEGHVREDDLPGPVSARPGTDGGFKLPPGGLSWELHEKECLRQALELAGGNRSRAARLLDMPYKAFLYRLEKFGLVPAAAERSLEE
ncbi:MAG: sigma-54-dependent Fis family transcriptional regulator [Acidobacteria bacterium]|nr:sigma-54-dependent Fis family transcriptional regulator [Acidobacteriota bacterium]